MSNFQKKYYYDFKSIDNKSNTVEIWQDISTGISSTKVIGAVDPFIVNLSGIQDKLQPVRGTGADLNLFATSSMQYMDLYTAKIQEYQVRHYINSVLNWCGYLDTEIFSSDLSRQKNYSVAMTANDGFALLDRLTYVQSNGTKFAGISSQFSILTFILQKLGLPIGNLYIALSTTISGVSQATNETLFHNTYVLNSNFYNEDGEPVTLRKVLESILLPYGAFIQQSVGNLYITDLNLIAGTEYIAKVYDGSTFAYTSQVTLNKNIGDLSTITFASSDQTLNIVGALNKQVVKYSPYISTTAMDYNMKDASTFSGLVSTTSFGIVPYSWTEKVYSTSANWSLPTSPVSKFAELTGYDKNLGTSEKYMKNLGRNTTNTQYTYTGTLPIIVTGSSTYYLKLEAGCYLRTTDNLGDPAAPSVDAKILLLHTVLTIGDKSYSNTWPDNIGWTTPGTVLDWSFLDSTYADGVHTMNNISDKWMDLKETKFYWSSLDQPLYIPLSGFTGTNFSFQICGYNLFNSANADITGQEKDVRLKDIKMTIVDSNKNEIQNADIEYVGYMNAQYKNEGNTIELIQGTNSTGTPTENGSLLQASGSSYAPIMAWTRGGVTDNIENLLLRTCVGNYENKTIEIVATTRIIPTSVGYLTYNLPSVATGKKFMLTSLKNDYANNTSDITMQEIFADSQTINKSF